MPVYKSKLTAKKVGLGHLQMTPEGIRWMAYQSVWQSLSSALFEVDRAAKQAKKYKLTKLTKKLEALAEDIRLDIVAVREMYPVHRMPTAELDSREEFRARREEALRIRREALRVPR